jgi:Protein of unknown function (DUF2721)
VNVQTAAKTIQLILAPVVMVSACGILLTGMLSHYAAINDRIRTLTVERLGLSQVVPAQDRVDLAHERISEIDHQVPMLLDRHRLVHNAILLAEAAVVILVLSMFVIAVAALSNSSAVGTVALMIFLAATAALMASTGYMAVEVRSSHNSVSYEAMRVIGLPLRWPDAGESQRPRR